MNKKKLKFCIDLNASEEFREGTTGTSNYLTTIFNLESIAINIAHQLPCIAVYSGLDLILLGRANFVHI